MWEDTSWLGKCLFSIYFDEEHKVLYTISVDWLQTMDLAKEKHCVF
ncbi:hypothetical protein HKBW3S06_00155 [Candidatus Hakubella thermalkaliphila]|uniref:Uncharacterized protein n=1 Tax=Candidatus Hakubella thermalkaliphila TaxID=2754717 RepID=A0A6V8NKZ0_9ACTN|nr:hypothetical protein HKBW3S06_00155 [Candidatus Hakubella thermalkaliphila]